MRVTVQSAAGTLIRAMIVACAAAATSLSAVAQTAVTDSASSAGAAAAAARGTMERVRGVWVEGPGFDIKYGIDYDGCARRCLQTKSCVMIEYYRPEKKCNMYDAPRPRIKGGSSDVAIRK